MDHVPALDISANTYLLRGSDQQRLTIGCALIYFAHALSGRFEGLLLTWEGRVAHPDQQDRIASLLEDAAKRLFGDLYDQPTKQGTRALALQAKIAEASNPNLDVLLTTAEGDLLVSALDFYSRLFLGQTDELANLARWNGVGVFADGQPKEGWDNAYAAEEILAQAHGLLTGMHRNASHGIFNTAVPEDARIAWDLQKVIRHRLAWDRQPLGGYTVNFDPPYQTAKDVPLATFVKAEQQAA
jgi:hypothetical protein